MTVYSDLGIDDVAFLTLRRRGRGRSVLALRLEEINRARAKGNESAGGGSGASGRLKSDTPIDTKKELARVAGVSHDTIMKVKRIEEKASPEQKQRLIKGRSKWGVKNLLDIFNR